MSSKRFCSEHSLGMAFCLGGGRGTSKRFEAASGAVGRRPKGHPQASERPPLCFFLSLIHISEPTRLALI
eukprot:6387646-Alexandrium_andersonii.AAC.1